MPWRNSPHDYGTGTTSGTTVLLSPNPSEGMPGMKGSIRTFQQSLLAWFEIEARDLPWRRTKDPYCVYLSEIMLQQTRVDQGTPYYERFLERFPTIESLAEAEEEAVLKQWEGLGYYTRARNLHRTARIIVEQYGGHFPESPELLQMLPGIGKYTAGAVASIAFDKPAPVVDGNVKRVLARLNAITEAVDLPATEEMLWAMASALLPVKTPGDFNQAMMELGARICTPKTPTAVNVPYAVIVKFAPGISRNPCPTRRRRKRPPPRNRCRSPLPGRQVLHRQASVRRLPRGLWEFLAAKYSQVKPTNRPWYANAGRNSA